MNLEIDFWTQKWLILLGLFIFMIWAYFNIIRTIHTNNETDSITPKASCFHPNTMIPMIDGKYKRMKDIEIGDILCKGNMVEATMKVKGGSDNPYYKIPSQDEDILVTGTHKIQDNKTGRFISVMDYERSEKTTMYDDIMMCLVTDDNLIPIGEYIFWDWED